MTGLVLGLKRVTRDLLSADLKRIEAMHDALSKLSELKHNALMANLNAFRAEMRSEFAALRATNQLEVYRQVSPLSERISMVEKRG